MWSWRQIWHLSLYIVALLLGFLPSLQSHIFIFNSCLRKGKFLKVEHDLGTEKEWSFHSPSHPCKGSFPSSVQHCRWRKHSDLVASAEGQEERLVLLHQHLWIQHLSALLVEPSQGAPSFCLCAVWLCRGRWKTWKHTCRRWLFSLMWNKKCLLPAVPSVGGLGVGWERMVECTFRVYLSFICCGFYNFLFSFILKSCIIELWVVSGTADWYTYVHLLFPLCVI